MFEYTGVNSPIQQRCIHDELILQYALDAQTHAEPWLLWEVYDSNVWFPLFSHPKWRKNNQYRRKPIDGTKPLREAPAIGQEYFTPSLTMEQLANRHSWEDREYDNRFLSRGLIYLTKQAAQQHAKALLGQETYADL